MNDPIDIPTAEKRRGGLINRRGDLMDTRRSKRSAERVLQDRTPCQANFRIPLVFSFAREPVCSLLAAGRILSTHCARDRFNAASLASFRTRSGGRVLTCC